MKARPVSKLTREQEADCMRGLVLSMVLRGLTFLWAPASEGLPLWHTLLAPERYLALVGKVFVWTLAYDFFYYWLHRFLHVNP